MRADTEVRPYTNFDCRKSGYRHYSLSEKGVKLVSVS
jgi:hypothetical protein